MSRYIPFVFCLFVLCPLSIHTVYAADDGNPPYRELVGHTGSVLAVVFTPDGKTLVSGSRDHTIKIWDVASAKLERTLNEHSSDVYCIAFSHDGTRMASGSKDGKLILWDAATFKPIRNLRGHTDAVRDVAFSPDDKTLASVAEDNSLRLWDVATGQLKVTRTDHTKRVKTVVYSPDGNTLITAASDATIRTWDAHTADPKLELKGHSNGVEFCDISPDGKQLFSGTGNIGEIIFWDAQTGKIEMKLPEAHGNKFGAEIDSGHYSPNGKFAVSGSKDRTDKFWDPKIFKVVHMIHDNPGRTESMCFSPDGKTLATGFGSPDSTIRLWDISKWQDN